MNPTSEQIEYAHYQIEEAQRRLESTYARVGVKGYQLSPKDGEYSSIEMTSTMDMDLDEMTEMLDKDPSEYDVERVRNVDEEMVGSHIQNAIIDCQLCIELAVKSMFKLIDKDHPFSHGISFQDGRTRGFYSDVPEDFDRKEDIVKVIFRTQFWAEFYELAKYGAPNLNVRPEMVFDSEDASRAVNDAEFCIEVAQDLLAYVEDGE